MVKQKTFLTKQDEINYILENSLSLERDLDRLGELMND
jgi:hypothetical protein